MKNAFACMALALSLAGCSGLTQMQDTIGKFDQGAHSVATGQMKFLRQVQIADCNNQFYSAAFNWAIKTSEVLDLSSSCVPTILDDDQLMKRQALMNALTLYADAIQTLASGDSNKAMDANSEHLANQLNGLAKAHAFRGISLAEGAEAAVIAVSEMALDQRKFNDIRDAAETMSPLLKNIVNTLKTENSLYAAGMASKMTQIQAQLKPALVEARTAAAWQAKSARGDEGTSARSFLDVIAAREIVRAVNPLGAAPVASTKGGADRLLDPYNVAGDLNAALDSLVNANDALAHAGTGGVIAAVHDLNARGQHANDVLSALKK